MLNTYLWHESQNSALVGELKALLFLAAVSSTVPHLPPLPCRRDQDVGFRAFVIVLGWKYGDVGCCLLAAFPCHALWDNLSTKMCIAKHSPGFFFHSLNKYLSVHYMQGTVAFIKYYISSVKAWEIKWQTFIHSLECTEHLWVSVTKLSSTGYHKDERDTVLPLKELVIQ